MSASLIVVTDDEPQVLAFVSLVLRMHDVKTFSSPLEAHLYLNTIQEPPSLLITDIVMPRMNGTELAMAYRKRFPTMPVLLMSGYTPSVLGDVPKSWKFLPKPFTPTQLKEAVAGLLA